MHNLAKKLHPGSIIVGSLIVVTLLGFLGTQNLATAALYSWTQTGWDGGVNSNVVTTNVTTLSEVSNAEVSANVVSTQYADADWFDTTWLYRSPITINNINASPFSNLQVKVSINTASLITAGKLQNDCDDLRFTNTSGTLLDYWISEGIEQCNTTTTTVWIEVDSVAASGNTNIYMYYGNNAASAASSGNNTFLFFDDFNAGSVDTNKWDQTNLGSLNSLTFVNGHIVINGTGDISGISETAYYMTSKATLPNNFVSETLFNEPALGGFARIMGVRNSSSIGAPMHAILAGNPAYTSSALYTTRLTPSGSTLGAVTGRILQEPNKIVKFIISSNGTRSRQFYNGLYNHESNFNVAYPMRNIFLTDAINGGSGIFNWTYARNFADVDPTATVDAEEQVFVPSGYVVSNIFNTTFTTEWNEIFITGSGNFDVKVRTDFVNTMSNAPAWSTCDPVVDNVDISSNNCVNNGDQYIQFRIEFDPNGLEYGEVGEIEISYQEFDLDNPTTNVSNVNLTQASLNDWLNYEPTITWDAGADNPGGAGIYGYCIALDETSGSSNSLDPAITGGLLQSLDDGVARTFCPFIVTGTSFDLSSVSGLNLTSGQTYYLSIKAVDLAGNISSGASNDYQDLTNFRFDNTPPENPAFITLPINFVSTKDVTISWPVGASGASDSFSGVAGLQYRIGQNGTWYGDNHNGSEDLTDLLANDGVYTTDAAFDYPVLVEGINKIYFRTLDTAGNISSSTLQGDIKINTSAPSEVQNLSVNPTSNTTNSYEFGWDAPATFTGLVSGIAYCYSVNVLPSVNSCNFTAAGQTNLAANAYATQPGTNTMFIVARGEASNINYATYQSIEFEYTGSAPGIPTNLDVSDISVKNTSNWRLALSWDVPTDVGAGISSYKIFRSTDANATCSSNFASFSQIGTSSSTSYIDTGLSQVAYGYCVQACDSANSCSATTGTVVETPTGKFTEPAVLITEPEVIQIGTRTARINWVTERASDSRVQLGTVSGVYFDEEISNSDQVANHFIALNNLDPGTTYLYRTPWIDEDGNIGVSSEKTFVTKPAPNLEDARVSSITTNSAFITMSVQNATQIRIVLPGIIDERIPTSTEFSNYTIPLTNLTEGTRYSYRIFLRDVDGFEYDTFEDRVFETLPLPQVQNVTVEELREVASPTVVVRWSTNVPTIGAVNYRAEGSGDTLSTIPNSDRVSEFEVEVSGLTPETIYNLYVTATDSFGNTVRSNDFTFTTATDTRPPQITSLRIGKGNTGAEGNNAQLIVTFETDEPTQAQIDYAEGSSGVYTNATPIETNFKTRHTIIINELKPNTVYNLQLVVTDNARNTNESSNNIVVTSKAEDAVFDVVLGELNSLLDSYCNNFHYYCSEYTSDLARIF